MRNPAPDVVAGWVPGSGPVPSFLTEKGVRKRTGLLTVQSVPPEGRCACLPGQCSRVLGLSRPSRCAVLRSLDTPARAAV